MFLGRLDDTFERILTDLILNSVSIFVIDQDVHCIVDNQEYVASVTYMRKPLEKASCEDRNHSLIIMQCIVIEIDGIKLPIFSDGEIYLSICMDETGITHPIQIRSAIAKQFFYFIIGIYRNRQYAQYNPAG